MGTNAVLWTAGQAARVLGVSRQRVHQLVSTGELSPSPTQVLTPRGPELAFEPAEVYRVRQRRGPVPNDWRRAPPVEPTRSAWVVEQLRVVGRLQMAKAKFRRLTSVNSPLPIAKDSADVA